jgi:MoaA/NifB/PqqE/SkfB family radical SAM enzyme
MRASRRWHYLSRAPVIAADLLLRGRYDFRYARMPMRASAMSLRKRANLLASGLNLMHRSPRPWGWPIHMHIELSSVCGLRCPVCPAGTGNPERPRGLMDIGLFERLMAEVGPRLLTASLWTWGEPLLHPHFADAIRITRRHGAIPLVSTNGQNLTDDRVRADLLREPPSCLIVSIDGVTEETNASYRVGARLQPILDGVRHLAEAKRAAGQDQPLLHMRFMVMRHNEHELPLLADFAADNGFEMLSLRALAIRGGDESEHRRLVPRSERYRAYEYRDGRRAKRTDHVCQMAFAFPAVLSDGTVTACDHDPTGSHAFGRLGGDGSFADIWFGARAVEVRRAILRDADSLGFCGACPYADRPDRRGAVDLFDLRAPGLRTPVHA